MTPKTAKEVYRHAWAGWCFKPSRELEEVMDHCQPFIARSPEDPAWAEFVETLPGFIDFWTGKVESLKVTLGEGSKKRGSD